MKKQQDTEKHLYYYDGLWSAYYVEIIFHKGNKSHKIKLDEGIRGINCKCKVTVDKDGWVYVC